MRISCIDMEGVLIPELWPLIAEASGIHELNITTREWPDYPSLVTRRIALLNQHRLTLSDIKNLLARVDPLAGACQFIEQLKSNHQVVVVSDAFREMIEPLWLKLGAPELRCHHLICAPDGRIERAHYTRNHGKHEVVEELKALGRHIMAVGDALNDLAMLRKADEGFLFCPSQETLKMAKGIQVVHRYEDILNRTRDQSVCIRT